jgi:hypothetical protein
VRRIFSVLVLFIGLWQIVGFFTFFEWEHYHIRKDIKRALKHSVPENQLKEFDFTFKEIKELTWVKPHEFKLNHHFYDVIEKTHTKNGFHLKCIDDIQETELFQKLEESTAYNISNSSPTSPLKNWIKLLKTPLEIEEFFVLNTYDFYFSTNTNKPIFHYRAIDTSSYQSTIYTPPKC